MVTFHQQTRLQTAKRSFVTRRVPSDAMCTLLTGDLVPQAGDLVLAKVTEIGHHKRSERVDGRKGRLFVGDEVILAYGNRYAPDQFEAIVPQSLAPCHMVAAGGIAGLALSWHKRILFPTGIKPIGLIGDRNGEVVNLKNFAVEEAEPVINVPNVVVVGTSMNAGKTTTAAHIIHGLAKDGFKVGAMKVTGTGAGNDLWLMLDAGAEMAIDFTDAGYPTSFKVGLDELMPIVKRLANELLKNGCNAIVVEVADGLYQRETKALLENPEFKAIFKNVVFTAREAMGATTGANWLMAQGYHVPTVSGMICASPLAFREAASQMDIPLMDLEQLIAPGNAAGLLGKPDLLTTKAIA
uniref:molybdopterin guanine dinucleotide synthesis B family protein n=1 Tax=Thaumasiovibrio occultus TaxID=1891184 RepID=UPI000B35D91A|nr:molybdopterin guanine dinucleotide synthesis B family protein [Thaumasiovibrio occultus]